MYKLHLVFFLPKIGAFIFDIEIYCMIQYFKVWALVVTDREKDSYG